MTTTPPATELELELGVLAQEIAREAQTFLVTTREIAAGESPDTALPMLLLAVSQVQAVGARLGAMVDVVPRERFEPDTGPDADLDALGTALGRLLQGVDEYVDLEDPVVSGEVVAGVLSNDITSIAADLTHGLRHFEQDRAVEALWWWQFSYLSSWGERCAAALRVLHGLLAHLRLDADEEQVMEAQLAALHADDDTVVGGSR